MDKKNNKRLAEMFETILSPMTLLNEIVVEAEKAGEKPFNGEYVITDAPIDDVSRDIGCVRKYSIDGIQCNVDGNHVLSLPIEIQSYEVEGDERVRVFADISAVLDGTILCTVSQMLNEEYVTNLSYLLGSSNNLRVTEEAHA